MHEEAQKNWSENFIADDEREASAEHYFQQAQFNPFTPIRGQNMEKLLHLSFWDKNAWKVTVQLEFFV